jgi:hypothetical protein
MIGNHYLAGKDTLGGDNHYAILGREHGFNHFGRFFQILAGYFLSVARSHEDALAAQKAEIAKLKAEVEFMRNEVVALHQANAAANPSPPAKGRR